MKILTSLYLLGQDGGHQVRRAGHGQPHPHWYRHDARDADVEVSERFLILPPSDLNFFYLFRKRGSIPLVSELVSRVL